jgi:hypothetical protein
LCITTPPTPISYILFAAIDPFAASAAAPPLTPLEQLIWEHWSSNIGMLTVPCIFVAVAAACHSIPIAGRTVQQRLKFTAAVASFVDMEPAETALRFEMMKGKFPIRILPAFWPEVERLVTFIMVASWTGSSFAKTMADWSFVLFWGSLRYAFTVLTLVSQFVIEFLTSAIVGGVAGESFLGTAAFAAGVAPARALVDVRRVEVAAERAVLAKSRQRILESCIVTGPTVFEWII